MSDFPNGVTASSFDGPLGAVTPSTAAVTILTQTGTVATDGPTLGAELLTGGVWTSAGWTGNNTTGWTHTAGNTPV